MKIMLLVIFIVISVYIRNVFWFLIWIMLFDVYSYFRRGVFLFNFIEEEVEVLGCKGFDKGFIGEVVELFRGF